MTKINATLLLSLIGSALLLGCGSGSSNSDNTQSSHSEGREETHNIRNTESIGYSGAAIADGVDAALDANEQRNQQLKDADQY